MPVEEHVVARSQRLSVVRWPWKRISGFDGDGVAYQLESDPDEQSPLPASAGELPEDREREAAKWLRALENLDRGRASSGERELDPEERQRSRALGYVK